MTTRQRTVRRRAVNGAARRRTAWDDQIVDFDIASGGQALFLLMENVADPEKRGCTLIRTIMGVDVNCAVPGQVSGQQKVSIGIMLVSDDAFVAGAAAMPNPATESEFPVGGWLLREQHLLVSETL